VKTTLRVFFHFHLQFKEDVGSRGASVRMDG